MAKSSPKKPREAEAAGALPASVYAPSPEAIRLRLALEARNVSEYGLAVATGVHVNTINDFVLGKSQRTTRLPLYAEALNIDPMWLIMNQGTPPTATDGMMPRAEQRRKAGPGSPAADRARPPGIRTIETGEPTALLRPMQDYQHTKTPLPRFHELPRDIPVYGVAAASDVDGLVDFSMNGSVMDMIRRPPGLAFVPNAFAVIVATGSMFPRFKPGEPAFINPSRKPQREDDVLVELYPEEDGEAGKGFLKYLVRETGRELVLGQYNPPKMDIKFPLKSVKHCYRVVPWSEALGF